MSRDKKVVAFPGTGRLAGNQHPSKDLPACVLALRASTTPLVMEQLQAMFDEADDALFEMSEGPSTDRDRRAYFDAMRHLRLNRAKMTESFEQAWLLGFEADPRPLKLQQSVDDVDLSLQSEDQLEEKIALGSVSARAESMYKHLLWDIGQRLLNLPPKVSKQALSPQHLGQAFQSCQRAIQIDLRIRLILYKLFERIAVARMGDVYALAIRVLNDHQIAAPQPRTVAERERRAKARLAGESVNPAELETIKKMLMSAPHRLARYWADRYTPQHSHQALPIDRLSLIDQLLQDLIPESTNSQLFQLAVEHLRNPLARVAMADDRFFQTADHPARALIDEAAAVLVEARLKSGSHAGSVTSKLQDIANQIDRLLSTTAGDAQSGLKRADLARFLDHYRALTSARRSATVERVRRRVAEVLSQSVASRQIPASTESALLLALAPVLRMNLLKYGPASAQWSEVVDALDQLLQRLDRAERAPPDHDWEKTLARVKHLLRQAGMRESRIAEVAETLDQSYSRHNGAGSGHFVDAEQLATAARRVGKKSSGADAAAAPPPDSYRRISADECDALCQIMRPGAYFSILDKKRAYTRWLRVWNVYPDPQYVAFAALDDYPVLTLPMSRIVDELATGEITPCDPLETAKAS